MTILHSGNCEGFKATAHGMALGIAMLCGTYNLAAWLLRRQTHLAVNAAIYGVAAVWEIRHVRHHLAARASVPAAYEPPSPRDVRHAA